MGFNLSHPISLPFGSRQPAQPAPRHLLNTCSTMAETTKSVIGLVGLAVMGQVSLQALEAAALGFARASPAGSQQLCRRRRRQPTGSRQPTPGSCQEPMLPCSLHRPTPLLLALQSANRHHHHAGCARLVCACHMPGLLVTRPPAPRRPQNLALNVAEKGFPISVYNRSGEKTDAAVSRAGKEGLGDKLHGYKDIGEFVSSLERPRWVPQCLPHPRSADAPHTVCCDAGAWAGLRGSSLQRAGGLLPVQAAWRGAGHRPCGLLLGDACTLLLLAERTWSTVWHVYHQLALQRMPETSHLCFPPPPAGASSSWSRRAPPWMPPSPSCPSTWSPGTSSSTAATSGAPGQPAKSPRPLPDLSLPAWPAPVGCPPLAWPAGQHAQPALVPARPAGMRTPSGGRR